MHAPIVGISGHDGELSPASDGTRKSTTYSTHQGSEASHMTRLRGVGHVFLHYTPVEGNQPQYATLANTCTVPAETAPIVATPGVELALLGGGHAVV